MNVAAGRVEDPSALSLADAAAAVREGRLRSRDLVEACLARIEAWQRRTNAFLAVEAVEARAAADLADAARARGRVRGPLHGVPLAHKDMFYRSGKVVTCGSSIRRNWTADATATVLARLARAGAIQLGALNMAEFAFNPTGHNYHFGHARNPWNPDCMTGGSSSGSGAAVAARLAFGALGSDTGGSIRLPAAACGVAGLKPTWGRVSRRAAMPLAASLDTIGPLARSAADCALLLREIAGPDAADPTASAAPVPDYVRALGRGVAGLRIALARGFFAEGVDAPVLAAVERAAGQFRALGATVVDVVPPGLEEIGASCQIVMFAEAASFHAPWLRQRPQDYSDQVRARLEIGLGIGAVHYLEALRARGKLLERFLAEAFAAADVILTPTMPFLTPTLAATEHSGSNEHLRILGGLTRFTRPVNFLGLPALSLPCGFDERGMPIGMQLVGRPFAEDALLAAGHAYERACGWHERAPALP